MRQSYLYNGNSYIRKTASLHETRPESPPNPMLTLVNWTSGTNFIQICIQIQRYTGTTYYTLSLKDIFHFYVKYFQISLMNMYVDRVTDLKLSYIHQIIYRQQGCIVESFLEGLNSTNHTWIYIFVISLVLYKTTTCFVRPSLDGSWVLPYCFIGWNDPLASKFLFKHAFLYNWYRFSEMSYPIFKPVL